MVEANKGFKQRRAKIRKKRLVQVDQTIKSNLRHPFCNSRSHNKSQAAREQLLFGPTEVAS